MDEAICIVEGCDRKVRCRGWCQGHYQRWRIKGDLGGAVIPRRYPGVVPHGTLHGYRYHKCRCDECRGKWAEYQREWHEQHPDSRPRTDRRSKLKSSYGISPEDYDAFLAAQGGGCAICGSRTTERGNHFLHVDHDHKTGRVRGVLCGRCNVAVGMFDDDVDRMHAAVEYLMR